MTIKEAMALARVIQREIPARDRSQREAALVALLEHGDKVQCPDLETSIRMVAANMHAAGKFYVEIAVDPKTKEVGFSHVALAAAAAWQPIETAPRDGTDIIVGFDFASVWIVHLAWWRSLEDIQNSLGSDFTAADVGWWTYPLHSVTQEKLEGNRTPTHWLPCPALPKD